MGVTPAPKSQVDVTVSAANGREKIETEADKANKRFLPTTFFKRPVPVATAFSSEWAHNRVRSDSKQILFIARTTLLIKFIFL
jgi:hypothetical protein